MTYVFRHDQVSRYADCFSLLMLVGFGLALSFYISNTTYMLYVIGRWREAWFKV